MAERGVNPFSVIGNLVAPRTTGFIMDQMDRQRELEKETSKEEGLRNSARAQEAFFATLQAGVEQGLAPHESLKRAFKDQNLMSAVMSDPNLDPNSLLQGGIAFLEGSSAPAKEPYGFMNVGERVVRTDPNAGEAEFLTEAPAPAAQVMSASQQLVQPDPNSPTGARVLHTVPTEQVQSFQALGKLAELSPKQFAEAAKVAMLAKTDLTQAERAGMRLVEQGVPQKTVDMLLSGGATPLTLKTLNPHGEVIEERQVWQLIDGTTIDPAKNDKMKSPYGTDYDQTDPASLELPDEMVTEFPNDPDFIREARNTMAAGVGATPILFNWTGSILQQLDPGLAPDAAKMARAQRNMLSGLQQALMNAREQGSGLGLPIAALNINLAQAPGMGPFEGAIFANRQLMTLMHNTKVQIASDTRVINDPNKAKATKLEAEKRIEMMRRILRYLPESMEVMMEVEQGLLDRKLGYSAGAGVKKGWEMVTGGGEEEANIPTVSTQEQFDALKSGDVYYELDANGQKHKVRKP